MADTFARPEDYFEACLAKMAGQRLIGLNAIRANPNCVGYSLTGTADQGMTGEGLTTTFREFKPGTFEALFDGLAPLRWCLFAEPVNSMSMTRPTCRRSRSKWYSGVKTLICSSGSQNAVSALAVSAPNRPECGK